MRRFLLYAAIGLVALFALIQLVPYRVDNPSVQHEPTWDSPQTRRLASVACFNCHSNDTSTYWFEDVAPLSWWITNHVKDGRSALNLSECVKRTGGESGDAAETVTNGSMPPSYYTWLGLHGDAKLTAQERQTLAAGLRKTLQGWNCGHGGG
jgi:mono/diheme cytochrome c family protein